MGWNTDRDRNYTNRVAGYTSDGWGNVVYCGIAVVEILISVVQGQDKGIREGLQWTSDTRQFCFIFGSFFRTTF
jgi:hypothetical protein